MTAFRVTSEALCIAYRLRIGGPLSVSDPGDVTALLRAWHAGDEDAYRRVSSILYDELRRRAAHCMRRERPGALLQTTALVHEAFVRLAPAGDVAWEDRRHFLNIAARTMRRVLVDLVRAHGATKRGSRVVHLPLDSNIAINGPEFVDLVALDVALEKLAVLDIRKVRVIELRFFGGLTVEEAAQILDVSPDTIARDWRMARAWLRRELAANP
jgi:RNA polymerase sigma factor (TIGR02999 family)